MNLRAKDFRPLGCWAYLLVITHAINIATFYTFITIPSQQASVQPVQWRSGDPRGGHLGVRTR